MMTLETTRELRNLRRQKSMLLACGHAARDAETAILHSEIRQHLKALNPAEREALIESGDHETWLACVLAPAFLSGLSTESIEKLRQRYVAATNPDEWASVNQQIALLEENHHE